MIRVLLLAPTPILQAGVLALLSNTTIQVVDVAAEPVFTEQGRVDVIVLADDTLLGDRTAALIAQVQADALVVLSDDDERVMQQVRKMRLRGWGIVPSGTPATQLQAAVQAASEGLITLPGKNIERLYASFYTSHTSPAEELSRIELRDEVLTPREQEVLELVSQGLSNKLIARKLHISEHTVKFHLSSVTSKLGASSRTDAVRLGVRNGLIAL